MEIVNSQINSISVDAENNHARAKKLPTKVEIQTWLVNYLVEQLDLNPARVDVSIPFERYGIDSAAAIVLVGDLKDWLEIDLEPTLIYDYPSIEELARHLNDSIKAEYS
uniref:Acyl carrier protein n=1 Tax=Cylindrospermum licheniforme UTEX B 2014 TaxID=379530 RepID=K7SXM8_9NOST|nr:acyl carrier protein [Cylindrospermum licheniforme UTEX B 2014]ARU81116.1 CylB [Cylindrospermum licheniforme UTEX B 2014]